jgi:hypothetical protein
VVGLAICQRPSYLLAGSLHGQRLPARGCADGREPKHRAAKPVCPQKNPHRLLLVFQKAKDNKREPTLGTTMSDDGNDDGSVTRLSKAAQRKKRRRQAQEKIAKRQALKTAVGQFASEAKQEGYKEGAIVKAVSEMTGRLEADRKSAKKAQAKLKADKHDLQQQKKEQRKTKLKVKTKVNKQKINPITKKNEARASGQKSPGQGARKRAREREKAEGKYVPPPDPSRKPQPKEKEEKAKSLVNSKPSKPKAAKEGGTAEPKAKKQKTADKAKKPAEKAKKPAEKAFKERSGGVPASWAPKPKVDTANKQTVYVTGLPFDALQGQIEGHFKDCNLISCRKLNDKATGKFKGIAFIDVPDEDNLAKALALHNSGFGGRSINVRHALDQQSLAKKAKEGEQKKKDIKKEVMASLDDKKTKRKKK